MLGVGFGCAKAAMRPETYTLDLHLPADETESARDAAPMLITGQRSVAAWNAIAHKRAPSVRSEEITIQGVFVRSRVMLVACFR
eukprot:4382381-Pleurochrysis_carterae.AAC.3